MNNFLNFIDYKLGRIVFSNDNNFLINLIGSFKLRNKLFKKKSELDLTGFKLINGIDTFKIKDFYNGCQKKMNINTFKDYNSTKSINIHFFLTAIIMEKLNSVRFMYLI